MNAPWDSTPGLVNINAYNQPGVEAGKQSSRDPSGFEKQNPGDAKGELYPFFYGGRTWPWNCVEKTR